MSMLIGVIADDFTGAGDIASTLAMGLPGEGGLNTAQFLGIPETDAPADVKAGVVSLKSRSIPAAEAVQQSLDAMRWLLAQGARQIIFKYCSTFDSTADGNIGPVAEALAKELGVSGVVVCPAFPGVGRTVYQGHLFVNDVLLNESGMENHPLTPMTDPDIRRVLRSQTHEIVAHAGHRIVSQGVEALRAELAKDGAEGARFVVVDAITNDDLVTIGAACADARLITGGSGIARGLPRNFIADGEARGGESGAPSVNGPEIILAGSCSRATRGQIRYHAERHPTLMVDVDAVMAGEATVDQFLDFLLSHTGDAPLVYSSADPSDMILAQKKYGGGAVAAKLDALFGEIARAAVARGVRRIVVAGGETSGAVVSALDLDALRVGREIDPGVPVLVAAGETTLGLALKSGNFGAENFFEKALKNLAGAA